MADAGVRLEGLEEFQRALRIINDQLPSAAARAGLASAKQTILYAIPSVPRVSGDTVATLQAIATSRSGIAQGGTTIKHYGWLELGGRSGRNLANVRDFIAKGRYIYPAYEDNQELVEEAMKEELIKVIKLSGLDIDSA